MKIEVKEEKILVYLYRYELSLDNLENLNKEIKNIFIKLVKVYKLPLQGYLKVLMYCNKLFGYILEIESLYNDSDFDTIDLKLIVYDNCEFYFKTDDYFIIKDIQNIYCDNEFFYVKLGDLDNFINLIEHGEIIHGFDKNKCKLM